jgi:hypothetical protein
MAKRPEVGVCTGKDCRRSDGYRTVQRELGRSCSIVEVSCLDVCDGPVVVLDVRSKDATVLERVRTRALALAIVDHLVAGVELSGRLRSRRVGGARRATARRRIARST